MLIYNYDRSGSWNVFYLEVGYNLTLEKNGHIIAYKWY